MSFSINEHQHNRYNPLKGEWILVCPHRALRPWGGQQEPPPPENVPKHDPSNPLCPGATRASGLVTENYKSTYVFTNDFPALLEEGPAPPPSDDPLFQMAPAYGTCRVICFHPHSDVHIGTMTHEEVVKIIDEWINQMHDLGKRYLWVQIFENRGAMMGCSNPHPHCQIWASSFMPNEPRVKEHHLREYYEKHGIPLLQDYVQKELQKKERIIYDNNEWVVLIPFWAVWPFETMILPKRQTQRFTNLDQSQKNELATAMQVLLAKYDNMFQCSFPYSMGWHGAPTGPKADEDMPFWTFHGCYTPPLLRSATVKKFMVGYELFAQSQRDLTPEKAADILRACSSTHYKSSCKC